MKNATICSTILQLIVDEGVGPVLEATHDALLIYSRVLREHGGTSHRDKANAIAYAAHQVGIAKKEAWPYISAEKGA